MLILRIRQAEVAIGDGRLDEAYDLVSGSEKLRSHRRGQRVVTRLMTALVKRGQAHLVADRPQQALVDCEKAARLGGNLPDVVGLRDAITDAIASRRRDQRRHAQALHAAREAIEAGRLAAGQQWLAQAGDESRALLLLQDFNAKRAMVESIVQSAQAAFDRDDLDVAAAELVRARTTDATDPCVVDLCVRVCKSIKQKVAAALNDGRLDLAGSLAERLAKLDEQSLETQRFLRGIEQSRLAWQAIDRGQARQAEEILLRLSTLFPDARWIKDAVKYAAQAEEALQSLRGGPLGLLSSTFKARGDSPTLPLPRDTGFQPVPVNQGNQHGLKARVTGDISELPSRFIIQVDGAGSFVVLRQAIVTLGPVSSSRMPDVGLIAEPAAPVVTIERTDDDYFIKAAGQIVVNDRPVTNKLLMRGDRIAISPRCRLAFNLPHAASTTATIDLSGGGRFPRADVKRVILLDRDIVIGPGSGTHIRCDQLSGNVVLLVRDGRLFVQTESLVTVDGRAMDRAAGISLGAHVDVGGLSFVITRG